MAAARQPRHREVARPEVPADALAGRAGLRAGHRLRGHRLPSHERSDVGGLTLHTACGLNREKDCLDTACRPDTARRIAFWRWLFLDEVGMVSARLLAQVDLRIRGAVPARAMQGRLVERGGTRLQT